MADPNLRDQILEVLADPMNLPEVFWGYMIQRWLADAPVFPISQVFGAAQTNAQSQVVSVGGAGETTTSGAYTDLATVGPTLTGLADGQYVIWFGSADCYPTAGVACMSVDINGAGASATDECRQGLASTDMSTSRAVAKTLSNGGSNTITCKYKNATGGSTATFFNRWLIALRCGNI